jgi:hypothetical protein
MGYTRNWHASVSRTRPEALGNCDRCDFTYNLKDLKWQFQWMGPKLQNLRILVCPSCMDAPQMQLRTILIPPDPIPYQNPRPDAHQLMLQSSSPPGYASGSPNTIATETLNPITTESSIPFITEINVTPTPTSSGYSDG